MVRPEDGAFSSGDKFGPYQLERQIAVGGMAEIYLAKATGISGFEKFVALKMIHPNYAEDEHFIEMLVEEAKIAVHLTQPNIVQIFDLGRIGDVHYIAMEYVDGPDLYHIMRSITEKGDLLDFDVAAFIALEVCAGLDYAHRCRDQGGRPLGIVHRDISPQNILVSRAGEVKLADFGIAKASLRAQQTAVGVIKGKYYYMSPEQAWGDPIDHRTDLFSTGVVLYETIVGQMLYLDEDLGTLLDKVRKAEVAPPSTLRPDVPPVLEQIVMKAVSRRPEDRFQSAHEFQVALTQFLFGYSPHFNVHRVQVVVERVLRHLERKRQVERTAREQEDQVGRDALMKAQEFVPLPSHSLINIYEAAGVSTTPGDELPTYDDFDDETVVSDPPTMASPRNPRGSDLGPPPILPVSVNALGIADPEGGALWDDETEETTAVLQGRSSRPRRAVLEYRHLRTPSDQRLRPGSLPGSASLLPSIVDDELPVVDALPTEPIRSRRSGGQVGGAASEGASKTPVTDATAVDQEVSRAPEELPVRRRRSSERSPSVPYREEVSQAPVQGQISVGSGQSHHAGASRSPGMRPQTTKPAYGGEPALADSVEEMILKSRQQRKYILIAAITLVVVLAVAIFIITAKRATSKPGTVVVDTVPSGARVYYRGRMVGTTPHRLEDLSLDEVHWVRLESDVCESKAVRLDVRSGKVEKQLVRLENCDK